MLVPARRCPQEISHTRKELPGELNNSFEGERDTIKCPDGKHLAVQLLSWLKWEQTGFLRGKLLISETSNRLTPSIFVLNFERKQRSFASPEILGRTISLGEGSVFERKKTLE